MDPQKSDTPGKAGGLMSVTAPRAGVAREVFYLASKIVLLYILFTDISTYSFQLEAYS